MGNHLIGHSTNLISAIFGDQLQMLVLDLGQILCVRKRRESVPETKGSRRVDVGSGVPA